MAARPKGQSKAAAIRYLAAGGMVRAKIAAHPDVQCKPSYVDTVLARAAKAEVTIVKRKRRPAQEPMDCDGIDERTARAMGIW